MQFPSALSSLTPQIFFLKKTALKKVVFSQKKAFLIFQETEIPYIFSKRFFLIFQEMEIYSPKNIKF